jgi:hypothetical protein
MRHLWSLLAGIVVAPLTWCLVALGQDGSQQQVGDWVSTRRWDSVDLIEPAAYLVVAGILVGLVATLRISPVGPLVGGLLLVAAYAGLFIAPLDVRDAVPDDWTVQDRHIALLVPLDNGTLALIGVLLVIAVFSADRWRGRPAAATTATAAPDAPLFAPGSPAAPGLLAAPKPAGEPVTTPLDTPEPQTVPIGTDPGAEASTAETSAVPPPASSEPPTESPWSAPPGQSRPENS